jgi:hypothetical protein
LYLISWEEGVEGPEACSWKKIKSGLEKGCIENEDASTKAPINETI